MAPKNTEERLIELESRTLEQEHLLQKLNEVIIEQQAQIDRLKQKLEELRHEVREGAAGVEDVDEPPPPHY